MFNPHRKFGHLFGCWPGPVLWRPSAEAFRCCSVLVRDVSLAEVHVRSVDGSGDCNAGWYRLSERGYSQLNLLTAAAEARRCECARLAWFTTTEALWRWGFRGRCGSAGGLVRGHAGSGCGRSCVCGSSRLGPRCRGLLLSGSCCRWFTIRSVANWSAKMSF